MHNSDFSFVPLSVLTTDLISRNLDALFIYNYILINLYRLYVCGLGIQGCLVFRKEMPNDINHKTDFSNPFKSLQHKLGNKLRKAE